MELDIDKVRALKVLGKGATGTVFLVYHDKYASGHNDDDDEKHLFALKVVEKEKFSTNAERRARHEISVLSRLRADHPFLPHLIGSSEDEEFIWWGIPFCPGGDLNVLRYRQNDHVFSPAVIRFYLAEIICALQHLHHQGIVYRDLKPENVLVQQSGHVTLTDFDLSRDLLPRKPSAGPAGYHDQQHYPNFISYSDPDEQEIYRTRFRLVTNPKFRGKHGRASSFLSINNKAKSARVSPVSRRSPDSSTSKNRCDIDERCNSFVGTEEYVAPEVIRGDGHEFAVDWWALGVLLYEMLYGTTPFKGTNRKETFRKILLAQPQFIGKPNALTDLIGKLLEKDPTRRLGYQRGASEIKEHDFFQGLRWDLLTEVLRPPYLPSRDDAEVARGGINIREYFQKLKLPHLLLWSPSPDDCRKNDLSVAEF